MLVSIDSILFIIFTEFIIIRMRSNPAHKKMNLFFTKGVFTNDPIIVAANIKNYPVRPITQQISSTKGG